MRSLLQRLALPAFAVGLALTAGCTETQPSRFYVLTALSAAEGGSGTKTQDRGLAVGIGPIELPKYLDRPQIVTRAGENELQLAEFDRWAEPLQDNVARVLTENLSVLLGTDRVVVYPWPSSTETDYQVAIEVTRFDATPDGDSTLTARWSLYGRGGREEILMRKANFSEPGRLSFKRSSGPQDYEATVAAMNRNLADLSREIATAIKAISR